MSQQPIHNSWILIACALFCADQQRQNSIKHTQRRMHIAHTEHLNVMCAILYIILCTHREYCYCVRMWMLLLLQHLKNSFLNVMQIEMENCERERKKAKQSFRVKSWPFSLHKFNNKKTMYTNAQNNRRLKMLNVCK